MLSCESLNWGLRFHLASVIALSFFVPLIRIKSNWTNLFYKQKKDTEDLSWALEPPALSLDQPLDCLLTFTSANRTELTLQVWKNYGQDKHINCCVTLICRTLGMIAAKSSNCSRLFRKVVINSMFSEESSVYFWNGISVAKETPRSAAFEAHTDAFVSRILFRSSK